jgi:gas vesicle protein
MHHREPENSGRGDFMVGLLCGTAVGAAIGLLLAPKSGRELRDYLSDSAQRVKRQAKASYSDAASHAENVVDDVVKRGREAVRRGREKFDEVRDSAMAEATRHSADE